MKAVGAWVWSLLIVGSIIVWVAVIRMAADLLDVLTEALR